MLDTMQNDLISIIIVTANSRTTLMECVARALASSMPVEVIISDNASTDGSLEAIAVQYKDNPQLHIVRNNQNLGFGTAVNRAAVLARGDVLLILNPDCLLEPDTLEKLSDVATSHPNAGVLGVRICDAYGRIEPASCRRDPSLRRALISLFRLSWLEAYSSAYAGVTIRDQSFDTMASVDAISGALIWIRRTVFNAISGFDEGYFLHAEDLDLCRRVRQAGYTVLYAGHISVFHAKGGSSQRRPIFVSYHKHRGMWRYFSRFDPAARNPVLCATVWSGIWLHFALTLPLRWASAYLR